MDDLNRDSIRDYQQASDELVQLENDGMITPAEWEIALGNTHMRGHDMPPAQLFQLESTHRRSMSRGMSQEHVLFVSERGLLGSAPKSTQVGDSIWILCGTTAPWVFVPPQNTGLHMPRKWSDDMARVIVPISG